MGRYRYRTSVLVGPWRGSREKAVGDAVRARQARLGEAGDELVWLVPGEIEVVESDEKARRH